MTARGRAVLTAEQTELLSKAVEQFISDPDELLVAMVDAALHAAPALAADPALEESVRNSVRAMTKRWTESQRRWPGHRVPVDVPPEALDVARDLIRHGVDFQQLQTGYRHAENIGCQYWIRATGTAVPPDNVAVIAGHGLKLINEWVGAALTSITDRIDQERDELLGGMHARRMETVTLILDGAPISENIARERLGYDTASWHTGLVLWSTAGDLEQGVLEKTARLTALRAGLPPPLTLPASASSSWTWLSSDGPLDPAELRDLSPETASSVVVAVGSSRPHLTGFRRTHREAVAARRIREGNASLGRFIAYTDVAIAVLASHEREAAREFVTDTLGELANADPLLRETLRVYLQEDANTVRTAHRLFTHRNTVLNRIERAERLLPTPLSGRRLHVGMALEIVYWTAQP